MIVYPWPRLVLITPPAVEPLTAAEAKARLNIGDEVSDEVMDAYIMAARQRIDGADGYLGRALNTQTWQGRFDLFPTCDGGRIYVPLPPLQTVTIGYLDGNGDPVTLVEGTDYQVVPAQRPYIVPLSTARCRAVAPAPPGSRCPRPASPDHRAVEIADSDRLQRRQRDIDPTAVTVGKVSAGPASVWVFSARPR